MMIEDPKALRELGWPELVAALSELCHTDAARAAMARLGPLPDADSVRQMLERVAEARALADRGNPLPFGTIWDLGPSLRRLDKDGVLSGESLVMVGQTLHAIDRLRTFLQRHAATAPGLSEIVKGLTELATVWGPIEEAFDETGQLADHASAELGRLRQRVAELHRQLRQRMKALLESPPIARHLQDHYYTQREDRYVLPIRCGSGPDVPGIVLGSSASGATLYVEPQPVVGLNNQLKVAETAVLREEARILAELSRYVVDELPAIRTNVKLVTLLDAIDARARLAIRLDACCPEISADGRLRLRAMRHPLMVLSGVDVVANDVSLSTSQTLVVSGPNAGGKTVCLKGVGLCALMLRAGLHLPLAPDSRLPLYELVLTDIDDDQSIERNLSTFTAHMRHVLDFLRRASPRTLVLLDEVATGTDPGEGQALAQALLEGLAAGGAQVIVTTHYEQLKALALADERFANASVGFDFDLLQPTYRLHPDLPGTSCALAVARRVGLPEHLGRRAEALMSRDESSLAALLTELAATQTALEAQREQLARAEQAARERERRHADKLAELSRKGKEQIQRAHQDALSELKLARADLQRSRQELRREATRERLEQTGRQVSAALRRMTAHEPAREPATEIDPAPVDPAQLQPGSALYVDRLGGLVEVVQVHSRGRLTVRRGPLRAQVNADEVQRPTRRQRREAHREAQLLDDPQQERPAGQSRSGPPLPLPAPPRVDLDNPPARTPEITLDARGMRVDEALDEAERFLDRGLLQDREVLYVVHGHGSGALRRALRAHLSASAAVRNLRPGRREEGGDAVTVIWLRD